MVLLFPPPKHIPACRSEFNFNKNSKGQRGDFFLNQDEEVSNALLVDLNTFA